jgi:hypothetical protein
MSMRVSGFILPAALVALGLSGCGPSGDSKTVSTPNGTVTTETHNDGSQTYNFKDSTSGTQVTMGTGAAANAKLPDYAPLYPGAAVETSVNASGSNEGGMVMFKTNASSQSVIDFYKKSAGSAGMSDVFNMTNGDTMSFSAHDTKTKHGFSVVATKADGATTVQVTWSNSNG